MDILNLLMGQVSNQDTLTQLGKSVGANQTQVNSLVQNALPTLLSALNKNASSSSGAQSLMSALCQHEDDDVSDISNFLSSVDTKDGSKILSHILGSKTSNVQNKLAQTSGLDASQVTGLLSQLAPLLLSTLGTQKKQNNSFDIGSLLGSSSQSNNIMGLASQFLDSDNDGDIMDDLGNLAKKFMK